MEGAHVVKKKPSKRALPQRELLSIEQQWELVDRLRKELGNSANKLPAYSGTDWIHRSVDDGDGAAPNQAMADLEHAWQKVVATTPMAPMFADRCQPVGDDGVRIAITPIEAVAVYLSLGYYPPPELLLVLRHTLQSYFDGEGDPERDLEICFFGKPKPKAGNHAKQRMERAREFRWAFEIMHFSKDAGGDERAAAEIVQREGLEIDAASVLRRARKRWKRVEPEE